MATGSIPRAGGAAPGDFAQRMARRAVKVEANARQVYEDARQLAFQSIVFVSDVTGSQGQPVDTGALRASWHIVNEGPNADRIVTDSPYAPQNEDGIARPGGGEYRLLAATGGRWSVALTIAGWHRIVAAVAPRAGTSSRGAAA